MHRPWLWKLALGAAGSYLALLGLAKVSYRALLYPAPRTGLEHDPPGGELLEVGADDGARVQAAVYPRLDKLPKSVVVYLHGNGETLADSVYLAGEVTARGLGFVAVEYRGYGQAPTDGPDEPGLYADAEATLRHLHASGVSPDRITLWGNSLGTGVAAEMARRGHATRLVLQAPFTSIPDVASRWVPWVPTGWIIADRFDTAAKASELTLPTLILHGDADDVVPYDMGVTLSDALPNAELITVPGGRHNDIFALKGQELLQRIARHAKG